MPFWFACIVGAGTIAFLAASGRGESLVVAGAITLMLACTAFHLISMGVLAENIVAAEIVVDDPKALPELQEL